jgi:hypothetical protein
LAGLSSISIKRHANAPEIDPLCLGRGLTMKSTAVEPRIVNGGLGGGRLDSGQLGGHARPLGLLTLAPILGRAVEHRVDRAHGYEEPLADSDHRNLSPRREVVRAVSRSPSSLPASGTDTVSGFSSTFICALLLYHDR